MNINGRSHNALVDSRTLLLDLLRKNFNLTGTKRGCDTGNCGSCTVILNGKSRLSCLTLALSCEGKEVLTIEGLAQNNTLNSIQTAFVEADALQCGFCTPGQIMSLKALLDDNDVPNEEEIKTALSGNICRCGAYVKILNAVRMIIDKKPK